MSDEVWEVVRTVYGYAVHAIWLLLIGMIRWGFLLDRKCTDLETQDQLLEREHNFLREQFDKESRHRDQQRKEILDAIHEAEGKLDNYNDAVLAELRQIKDKMA